MVLGLVLAALLGRAPLLGLSWFDAAVIVGLVGAARSGFLEASNAPLLAIWQSAVPRSKQGRVFGARRLLAQAPYPIAVWLGGVFAEQASATWGSPVSAYAAVLGAGIVIELVAAAALAVGGSLRRLERAGEEDEDHVVDRTQ
ncbi:hypothetical protein [Brevibacterium otitidis]|uniref:hypothetical protein n=1 Tax=Brevibacterium otitidis TaxID=53364 RepID=UPI003615BCB3|nr:hypothetical protein GCM10023233_07500 [Brevibacterium otitidis]